MEIFENTRFFGFPGVSLFSSSPLYLIRCVARGLLSLVVELRLVGMMINYIARGMEQIDTSLEMIDGNYNERNDGD